MIREAGSGQRQMSVKQISNYMQFFSRTSPLWHREFSVKFVPVLCEALLNAVSCFNEDAVEDKKLILGAVQ